MGNSIFEIDDVIMYGRISVTITDKKYIAKIGFWMYEIENPINKNKMFVKETDLWKN
jgi:hypothetical protein